MTRAELESLLGTVGKEKFITFFYGFKEVYSPEGKQRLAEDMVKTSKKGTKVGGELTRINCAKRIIDEGMVQEALQIIIDSDVPEDTKSTAQEIKFAEKFHGLF